MSIGRVQLAIGDGAYAKALRDSLIRNGVAEVVCIDTPDTAREGVMVLDEEHLDRLPAPLDDPEHVVLIAHNAPGCLSRAWDVGVKSVVYDKDPLNTVVLAILSAGLRAGRKPSGSTDAPQPVALRAAAKPHSRKTPGVS